MASTSVCHYLRVFPGAACDEFTARTHRNVCEKHEQMTVLANRVCIYDGKAVKPVKTANTPGKPFYRSGVVHSYYFKSSNVTFLVFRTADHARNYSEKAGSPLVAADDEQVTAWRYDSHSQTLGILCNTASRRGPKSKEAAAAVERTGRLEHTRLAVLAFAAKHHPKPETAAAPAPKAAPAPVPAPSSVNVAAATAPSEGVGAIAAMLADSLLVGDGEGNGLVAAADSAKRHIGDYRKAFPGDMTPTDSDTSPLDLSYLDGVGLSPAAGLMTDDDLDMFLQNLDLDQDADTEIEGNKATDALPRNPWSSVSLSDVADSAPPLPGHQSSDSMGEGAPPPGKVARMAARTGQPVPRGTPSRGRSGDPVAVKRSRVAAAGESTTRHVSSQQKGVPMRRVEAEMDRLRMEVQELSSKVSRSRRAPPGYRSDAGSATDTTTRTFRPRSGSESSVSVLFEAPKEQAIDLRIGRSTVLFRGPGPFAIGRASVFDREPWPYGKHFAVHGKAAKCLGKKGVHATLQWDASRRRGGPGSAMSAGSYVLRCNSPPNSNTLWSCQDGRMLEADATVVLKPGYKFTLGEGSYRFSMLVEDVVVPHSLIAAAAIHPTAASDAMGGSVHAEPAGASYSASDSSDMAPPPPRPLKSLPKVSGASDASMNSEHEHAASASSAAERDSDSSAGKSLRETLYDPGAARLRGARTGSATGVPALPANTPLAGGVTTDEDL